ncbi:hypothetical protein ABBQ32_002190 [Trebouxia sp. C0010 RCD-2024]
MPTVKAVPARPPYRCKVPAGPPLDYCFMDISSLKNLQEVKPMSGFVKGQPAPVVQPNKSATPPALVSNAAISTTCEGPSQPMQQVQQSTPVEYERNSLAIKLSNNPLASLTELQEAVASVLDEPVSFSVFPLPPFPWCYTPVIVGAVQDNKSILYLVCVQAELRWLDLSQCKLTSIQDELTKFPKLQMLYLHANQLTKLSEVKKLGKLASLQKLTLHGNPIAELPHYK